MTHAHQKIILYKNSNKYVTINMHKGLCTYNRPPFGVASSPAIFQHTIEGILQDITRVTVYLDCILVSGANEHLQNLDEVLSRIEKSGLRQRRSKCESLGEVEIFLGHKINAIGLQSKDRSYIMFETAGIVAVKSANIMLHVMFAISSYLLNANALQCYKLPLNGPPMHRHSARVLSAKCSLMSLIIIHMFMLLINLFILTPYQ